MDTWPEILKSLEETIYMVFTSGLLSALFGIPLGVVLCVTQKDHILENTPLNLSLGAIVNAARSVPFIILMIAIIPLTRLMIGTSIGTTAAIVPLTLSAIPFVARLAQNSLSTVSSRLIEAGKAMGASKWQIITKILLPEAKPKLIDDITVTLVNLVGYSAMAGTVGGGGLGSLAIHYGYQRFDISVMFMTVVILIVFVQLLQATGDYVSEKASHLK